MNDDIQLPPLPPVFEWASMAPTAKTIKDYARAAVLADRERRAGKVKPMVHFCWIELFPDGSWTSRPGVDGYHDTSMMLNVCWTADRRAWIGSKQNGDLAQLLRKNAGIPISDAERLMISAADALDGGER